MPGTDFRVRIFTPASELPMAGHPTIGTAFALARAGRFARGQASTVFGEGVGPIPLDLEWTGADLAFAWMTQRHARVRPLDRTPRHAGVGRGARAGRPARRTAGPCRRCRAARRSCWCRSAPVRPWIAPRPMPRMLARAFAEQGWPQRHVYLFTLERGPDDADVYTRMFAPDIGIVEDPATGSASGPLGGYLVQRELPSHANGPSATSRA